MKRLLPVAIPLLLSAHAGCTTVYAPPDEPLTEAGLEEAVQTLRETGERIEILEDGLRVEVYVYRWRRHLPPPAFGLRDPLLFDSALSEGHEVRMLSGPPRSVYLPYTSILAVEARSWPLWAGVELAVDEAMDDATIDGPVVIRARDVAEAERLADAIDRVRRARQPPAASSSAPAPGD